VALNVMAWRLAEAGRSSVSPTVANGFTWGTALLAIALSFCWCGVSGTGVGAISQTSEENARFIAAAESSPDAFSILDSVRNKAGEIVGLRYRYVNAHAEKLLQKPRIELLDHDLCEVFPADSTGELFERYRKVVLTGEPLCEDLSVPLDDGGERWLRRRIHKLDDGVAVTVSDVTEVKENEERFRSLSNFSNSVFDTAPFSIIETDLKGMIRAMNGAAEKLTGYSREEMVGKVAITTLHEPTELTPQTCETTAQDGPALEGFALLTAKATQGEVEETGLDVYTA
jgi:PAS domain-containing protein